MIERQRGFALTELLVCVGLLALVGAATIGGVAAVAHGAMPNGTRDAAMMVAENALTRARAAAAYVPRGNGVAASDPGAAGLIAQRPSTFTAGAELRSSDVCGAKAPTMTLQLPVQTSYANGVFTVTVTYPRDPCGTIAASETRTVTLRETLPPPVYVPGHVIDRSVGVPARM